MTRIDQARRGFLQKDLDSSQQAHTKEVIAHGISHSEKHSTSFTLPEIILGGQDGLVNVLGVILGVAAATADSQIVIVAGLAATFAESISMAAVEYTSKLAEADYYQAEYEREMWEIDRFPDGEREEVRQLYRNYGFTGPTLEKIVRQITSSKELWVRVMMEQELKLEPVNRKDTLPAAIIVGISALVGSFIPLTSFFFLPIGIATVISLLVSAATLFAVGYYKAQKTLGRKFVRSGVEMMVIGMVSAFVGFLIGSLFKVTA